MTIITVSPITLVVTLSNLIPIANRKQYAIFNNCNSDVTEIDIGVPQGSTLDNYFLIIRK